MDSSNIHPIITVDKVCKTYGTALAVDTISFEVPPGVVCGFIGPNGSGKTTTLRLLLGLVRPTSGSAKVLGHSIEKPAHYLHRVGALIEGPAFYSTLSGRANLALLARLGRLDARRVEQVLDFVGLSERGHDHVRKYSLGMKQRLGIAAALLPNPELLILDEPTNGLDPEGIAEMRTLLRLLADTGITIFVSSHLLSELEHMCNHLVMMQKGRVIFAGEMVELMTRTQPRLTLRPEQISDLSRLLQVARNAGYEATIAGDVVLVQASHQAAASLNRAAMTVGVTLIEIIAPSLSLEEVFFQLTRSNTSSVPQSWKKPCYCVKKE